MSLIFRPRGQKSFFEVASRVPWEQSLIIGTLAQAAIEKREGELMEVFKSEAQAFKEEAIEQARGIFERREVEHSKEMKKLDEEYEHKIESLKEKAQEQVSTIKELAKEEVEERKKELERVQNLEEIDKSLEKFAATEVKRVFESPWQGITLPGGSFTIFTITSDGNVGYSPYDGQSFRQGAYRNSLPDDIYSSILEVIGPDPNVKRPMPPSELKEVVPLRSGDGNIYMLASPGAFNKFVVSQSKQVDGEIRNRRRNRFIDKLTEEARERYEGMSNVDALVNMEVNNILREYNLL